MNSRCDLVLALGVSLAAVLISVLPVAVQAMPMTVTVAGNLQSELGCPGDWQPGCSATGLAFDAADDVWQGIFNVPAGSWEYKAALNGSWDENYGRNAQRNGPNILLNLAVISQVKIFYDDKTHWITDNVNSVIATLPGSFQSELGCPGDWQPDCLRTWLQDPDGDGIYSLSTTALPVGAYELKIAHDESWTENYGAGGVANGLNVPFSVPSAGTLISFAYDPSSHLLTITVEEASSAAVPASVLLLGFGLAGLGLFSRRPAALPHRPLGLRAAERLSAA